MNVSPARIKFGVFTSSQSKEGERGLGAEQIDCAFFRDGTAGLTNCATQPKQANVNPRLILKEAV